MGDVEADGRGREERRLRVLQTFDVEPQVAHQVGLDHAFDDVPAAAIALQPIVPPAREDRLQCQLRASLERRVVRTRRGRAAVVVDLHDHVADHVLRRRHAVIEMDTTFDEILTASVPRSWCALPCVCTVALVNSFARPSMSRRSSSSAYDNTMFLIAYTSSIWEGGS